MKKMFNDCICFCLMDVQSAMYTNKRVRLHRVSWPQHAVKIKSVIKRKIWTEIISSTAPLTSVSRLCYWIIREFVIFFISRLFSCKYQHSWCVLRYFTHMWLTRITPVNLVTELVISMSNNNN